MESYALVTSMKHAKSQVHLFPASSGIRRTMNIVPTVERRHVGESHLALSGRSPPVRSTHSHAWRTFEETPASMCNYGNTCVLATLRLVLLHTQHLARGVLALLWWPEYGACLDMVVHLWIESCRFSIEKCTETSSPPRANGYGVRQQLAVPVLDVLRCRGPLPTYIQSLHQLAEPQRDPLRGSPGRACGHSFRKTSLRHRLTVGRALSLLFSGSSTRRGLSMHHAVASEPPPSPTMPCESHASHSH